MLRSGTASVFIMQSPQDHERVADVLLFCFCGKQGMHDLVTSDHPGDRVYRNYDIFSGE